MADRRPEYMPGRMLKYNVGKYMPRIVPDEMLETMARFGRGGDDLK
jgi:hypothetical protein